jgi:hypothetical protein
MSMNPRLLRPTASGFNPKSIAGLEAWYDAGKGITIQTGVQKWADQSGKGRDLIQDITNNQPAYNSVTLNGKPTVTFDGLAHRMVTTATFSLAMPIAGFIIFRFESAYVSGSPRVLSHGGVGTRAIEFFRNNTNDLRLSHFGSGAATGFVRFRKNVSVIDMASRVDLPAGELQNFNVYDFEQPTGGNPVVRVEMAQLQNSSFGNVSIAEYLLFSRVLAVTEADRVRQYLGRKYNLAFQA